MVVSSCCNDPHLTGIIKCMKGRDESWLTSALLCAAVALASLFSTFIRHAEEVLNNVVARARNGWRDLGLGIPRHDWPTSRRVQVQEAREHDAAKALPCERREPDSRERFSIANPLIWGTLAPVRVAEIMEAVCICAA